MSVEVQSLAQTLVDEVRAAGAAYRSGENDFQKTNAVFLETREVCRVYGLLTKIAEQAKSRPSKDVLRFAGIPDPTISNQQQ